MATAPKPMLRLVTFWCGMLKKQDSPSTVPKCTTVGVM